MVPRIKLEVLKLEAQLKQIKLEAQLSLEKSLYHYVALHQNLVSVVQN